MDDWCGEVIPTHFKRNNGSRKRRLITGMETDSNVVPCKENEFFLEGGSLFLDKGPFNG